MSNFDPKASLQAVVTRRPDALCIIAMATGIPEKRLKQIHDGKGEPPTSLETMWLDMWSTVQ